MKKYIVFASLLLASVAVATDYYKGTVTRIERNLYHVDGSDLYIQTKSCYEYARSAKALLAWEGPGTYDDNKLMFLDYKGEAETTCDVVKVFRAGNM